jgi:hypothetical protein
MRPSRLPRRGKGFAASPTRRGKGTKIVAVAADNTFPRRTVEGASPAECRLLADVLAGSFLPQAHPRQGLPGNHPITNQGQGH